MKIKRLLTGVLAGFCAVSAFTFSGCGNAKENVVIYSAAEDYRIEHIRKRMEEQLPDYTPVFQSMNVFVCIFWLFLTGHVHRWLYHASAVLFCRKYKPKKQSAEKAMPQRMYVPLKNSRLTAYRMGIRVKSTVYGSVLPIASMAAVTRNGLTPHRYAPRIYSASFSATAGSRSPST